MEFTYIQEAGALRDLARVLMEKPAMTLAVDTETTGLDPLADKARILLCQIGLPSGAVYVVNAAKLDLAPLKPVLEGKERLLLLQNAKFDYRWLKAKAGLELGRVYDTMLAEGLLNAGTIPGLKERRQAVSLKRLAAKYLGQEMSKTVRKEFIGYLGCEFGRDLLEYAAADVPSLFAIQEMQKALLAQAGLIDVAKLEFATLSAVGDMELNGLGVDQPKYRENIAVSRAKMVEAEAELRDYLRKRQIHCNLFDEQCTNFNSTPQLHDMFKLLGNPVASTEEKFLETVNHPVAAMLLTWRKFETQVSAFGESVLALVHPVTGRLHPEFDQMGADSGRFSCKLPNLQQIPAEERFRSCFIPREGNVMVVGDWSQFELRILCEFSHDRNMLAAFEAGRDMHSDTAARMYGLAYEEVTKKHPARQDAKVLNFALAYGMGPGSLAALLKCSLDDAKEKMRLYFEAYPGVKTYLDRAGAEGVKRFETRTGSGRRRLFTRPEKGEKYREKLASIARQSKNTPIQGTNGDALKLAMARLRLQIKEEGLLPGMVACVHDEIVMEVPERLGEHAREVLEHHMVSAGRYYLPNTPVKADVGIANCWQK